MTVIDIPSNWEEVAAAYAAQSVALANARKDAIEECANIARDRATEVENVTYSDGLPDESEVEACRAECEIIEERIRALIEPKEAVNDKPRD